MTVFVTLLKRFMLMVALALKIVILVFIILNTNILMGAENRIAPSALNSSPKNASKISLNQSAENKLPIILVVGDSISAAYGIEQHLGWVALLEQKLTAQNFSYEVVNASVSGNTSADGLRRLPKLLKQYRPNIVVIELGGNDGLRGHPIKLMKNNLQQMIDLSLKNNAQVLLAGIEIPPNYGVRYTTLFRDAFQSLAATNRNIQYDPFILDAVATKPELMQSDGIHPIAAAQPQLLINIWDDLYPLLIPEK
jgi:acyl-CoA thioesterase-1